MRLTFVISFLLLAFSSLSWAQISESEEIKIIQEIAKSERRDLWRGGFENVSSTYSLVSREEMDELLDANISIEEPLERDQIQQIRSCFRRTKTCRLYLIHLQADRMGGTGIWLKWVMLNPKDGSYSDIHHFFYAE